jgi:nucleotide-binding universal stress UspA family protein
VNPEDNKDSVHEKDRHLLVALDDSENSKRALLYTADYLGGVPGFRVTLLSIVPEPSEDYFEDDMQRAESTKGQRSRMNDILWKYREILIQAGFKEEKVEMRVDIKECPSIAECILRVQKELDCCTVVVGRRVLSKREEFIFGSTSSRILHMAKSCAVWVVE